MRRLFGMSDAVKVVVSPDSSHDFNFYAYTKTFSTGSRGYHTSGKIILGDKRYQVNIMLVEIGSKPDSPNLSSSRGEYSKSCSKCKQSIMMVRDGKSWFARNSDQSPHRC